MTPMVTRQPLCRLPMPTCDDVRSRRTTSMDLTRLCLERIEALNPQINAFVALDPSALDQAADSDRRLARGEARSPIEGVPVAIKDNMLVRGLPATWGDRLFDAFMPEEDELPIRRLRAAGAVILGKTNTPPIASAGITDNDLFGPTRNPWDLSLTPGGSSGGSAAAVAAGLVPLGLGTDGGGSTRRPAAHTGIWGFKPSIGLIARGGGFPAILGDLEVVGPMARNLADLHALTSALAGPDPGDPSSRFLPAIPRSPVAPKGRLRIAVIEQIEEEPVDPSIRRLFWQAVERLGAAGHDLAPRQLPAPIATFNDAFTGMSRIGLALVARQYPRFREVSALAMRDVARQGEAMDGGAAMAVHEEIRRLRGLAGAWFTGFDLLLMPATAAQPWPIGQNHPPLIDGRPVGPRGHAIFTSWVNVIGHPSLAVPIGLDTTGLPVGMQIIGAFGADALVLEAGLLPVHG